MGNKRAIRVAHFNLPTPVNLDAFRRAAFGRLLRADWRHERAETRRERAGHRQRRTDSLHHVAILPRHLFEVRPHAAQNGAGALRHTSTRPSSVSAAWISPVSSRPYKSAASTAAAAAMDCTVAVST